MDNIVGISLLQQQPQGSMTMNMIIFGAVIAIFYFLIIRPQRKKQKETKAMIAAVVKGNKITTIGGIRGTVSSVKEDSVVVKVDDNTKIVFAKSAIATVDTPKAAAAPPVKKVEDTPSKNDTADVAAEDKN